MSHLQCVSPLIIIFAGQRPPFQGILCPETKQYTLQNRKFYGWADANVSFASAPFIIFIAKYNRKCVRITYGYIIFKKRLIYFIDKKILVVYNKIEHKQITSKRMRR